MARPLEDIRQRGGTRIFIASTATTLATILTTRLWLATGTITALPGRGGAMTRSQPVEVAESVAWRACAQSSGKKSPGHDPGLLALILNALLLDARG
jgi:hypothetical protein